jgi:hypothetical protein
MSELPKIVRERLAQVPAGPHPDPDLLNAFAEHTLAPRERSLVMAHVSACQECRQLISLAALPLRDSELSPPPPAPAGRWFAWSYMRWSGAVAAVLLVASIALIFQQQWKQPALTPATSPAVTAKVESAEAAVGEKTEEQPSKPADADSRLRAHDQLAKSEADAAAPPSKPAEATASKREQARGDYRDAKPAAAPPPSPVAGVAAGVGAPASSRDEPAAEPQLQAELKKEKDQKFDSLALMTPGKANEANQAKNRAQAANAEFEAPAAESTAAPAATADQRSAENSKLARQASTPGERRRSALTWMDSGSNWRVTDGALERTADGRTWNTALSVPEVRFTAVATLGNNVWAGGSGGVLYVTSDNGRRWIRRQLNVGGTAISEEILAIAIDDARHGRVDTAGGTYITTDAAATWQRAP